jgi:hypothetical protein
MKRWIFILCFLNAGIIYAADPEQALKGVASPTDGYIKAVQFIVSIYKEPEGGSGGHSAKDEKSNTQSMRVGDGQAVFIGTATEIPASNQTKSVEHKSLESGIALRPHLMGLVVQLELVEKNETWNVQTQKVDVQKSRSVVTVPLGEWAKVKGTINDNEDIEDMYSTNREPREGLWVKVELAPN